MSKPTTEIDLSGFGLERLQHIGRGQYASAQLVKETASGQTFVAKCISLAALNEHDQDLAHQEVFLLQTLSHPYIVAYRDSFLIEGANTLVIVMEYCGGGDVRKAIKDKAKEGGHFTEEQIMTWFVQLCLALQYIHSEKVLHRDLKTSNIFLTEDGSAIKLGDFGISRVLEGTTEAAVTIVGTPYYMSPEVCRSEPYNWKSDIWALGCVLYECCMLKHAFESSSLLGLVYKIVSDHYDPIPSFYSPELNDLINKLLMKNAESRPSINELFANPYVKAYLAKQSAPVATPSPPSSLEPAGKKTTLRPGGAAKPPPPPPPPPKETPPAPGPAPLAPESKILVIIARIRRRLVGQKLNWISSCASFDDDGDGALTPDAMGHALMTMPLGLSDDEIKQLTSALSPSPGAKISLDAFSAYLQEVADEVKQYETWARQVLAPPGKRLHDLLRAKDIERSGTLAPSIFQDTLQELVPVLTPPHLDLLALLADKNCLGDVDYGEFLDTFGAPVAPPSSAPPGPPGPPRPPAPPGMPPLPGMSTAPAPPGMPPLPGVGGPSDPLGATLGGTLGGSLGSVEINFEKTFFTCTSSSALQGTNAGRMSLSAQGCALIFGRLRRRLEAAGLALSDALALFLLPGERELTAEQWLDVASTLPLGTSRAEMQQLFLKVDADGSGKVALATLEQGIARANSEDCCKPPTWISAAITQRGLCNRISSELQRRCTGGSRLAPEGAFRRVIMETERYLTSDQLTSLILLADKNSGGLLDYEEFTERFGGSGGSLGVPGGALPPPAVEADASAEEISVVCARTAAVMESHGFQCDRLPSLLALWGSLELPSLAAVIASLPLGLSRREAVALLSHGSVEALVANMVQVQSQGIWRSHVEWAQGQIPGHALRQVLHHQVIEAESRTLEPGDFMEALANAGVPPNNIQMAMWLAQKTSQGDVQVASFLESFSGSPQAAKKKRGLLWRMMGR
ncbi:NEK1 [Symbiodinium sp. CCMP2456]|nr:NEK1 [Symbiodinium sp. CCMP2456]